MALSTLDILDKNLSSANDDYLNLPAEVRFRFFREEFLLDKNYWDTHYTNLSSVPFDWKEFKYSDIRNTRDLDRIVNSSDTGVYLFVIKSDNLIYDLPKFVFYVGIAGEGKSQRPLKERLKDYFHISEIKKRKKIHRMLNMYHKNVYVAFSLLKKSKKIDLEKIEKDLHGFFYPVCGERDFPIELKDIKKSF